MREVLFKGQSRKDGKWIYGSYIEKIHRIFNSDGKYIVPDYITEGFICVKIPDGLASYEIFKNTRCQFTGKKMISDKTNEPQKLFESDIIEWSEDYDDKFGSPIISYGKGVIVWNEENCCFSVKLKDNSLQDFNNFDFDDSCVIIGNIHDDPELIEEEK